jgi:histidinol-phosphate aminotransferase
MLKPFNAHLPDAEAYTPGLTRETVAATFGLPADRVVKLGSAENALGPSPLGRAAVERAMAKLEVYPDWTAEALRAKLAAKLGVDASQVFCGAGETELIPLIVRCFAGPGQKLLMHEPCFPIYHLVAEAEGRACVFVPMGEDFSFREEEYLSRLDASVKVAFLTYPHSPTGKLLDLSFVEAVCRKSPDTAVVLDEAYWHFSHVPSGMSLVAKHPNLIVLRTFSKAYGLAGLRVGFGVASQAVARMMLLTKPTWNLGQLQVAGAVAALDDDAHVDRTTAMIAQMRDYVEREIGRTEKFRGRFCVVPGSKSNFFLLEVQDAALDSTKAFDGLLRQGVIVKDCSVSFRGLGRRYLRIDVGPKPAMDRLLEALATL